MTPAVVLGVVLLAIYWAWIALFFARVRPWLMARLGSRLDVRVRESLNPLDAGTWGASGRGASLPKSGIVMAADLAILLVGVVGVAALLFIPAFLVADSGALLPLKARLTGRGAELRVSGTAEMTSAHPVAPLPVEVANSGVEPLRDCYAMVDGYSAQNGYLHGRSARFDLAVGGRIRVPLALEAMRPSAGSYDFRLKLECANERLATAGATLRVR